MQTRAAIRNVFGSPPASTVRELPSVLGGLRGWPRRLCISHGVQHFGWSRLILGRYAITQARNTFAIFAACFAWVLVTVLDVWLGK